MPDLFRYSNSFEPILLEGMTATLKGANLPEKGKNVACQAVGALPEYYKDFGTLTAATWDNDNSDTNLEMGAMELGQFRMRILDDMQCRLKNPTAVSQWTTKDQKFYLRKFPSDPTDLFMQEYIFKASEFFIFENKSTPTFDFYSAVALATSRVLFSGWRFKLTEIATPGRITLWVNSWPSRA